MFSARRTGLLPQKSGIVRCSMNRFDRLANQCQSLIELDGSTMGRTKKLHARYVYLRNPIQIYVQGRPSIVDVNERIAKFASAGDRDGALDRDGPMISRFSNLKHDSGTSIIIFFSIDLGPATSTGASEQIHVIA
jgi:hypothetical protein